MVWRTVIALLCVASLHPAQAGGKVDLRKEYAATLLELSRALLDRQVIAPLEPQDGSIRCVHCDVLHTRAAESVFPFARAFHLTGDSAFGRAAIRTGNWLIRQQEPDGSWKETPEEWTGTTTDQMLMMVLAYEEIHSLLTAGEQRSWLSAIEHAADYLAAVMTPEFASINYVATTTASLTAASRLVPKPLYTERARLLARRTVAKMDADGFINGEGGRTAAGKSGVDLGYDMEMSLWGLGYYARSTGDTVVGAAVRQAVRNHLFFIYPDGSMDGSWGIRSNKWTMFGGATSDGCQVLFSLYADDDPRYATAAYQNLAFLRTCINDGLVGYGPQHAEVFSTPPCIYPTFAKAKNLALAYRLESGRNPPGAPLPTQRTGWMKVHTTLDVAQVRTKNFMATVTAYGYEDHAARAKSKYMYRPSGGAQSYLWLEGHGALQASSVTVYSRPEPMHFPEAPDIRSLTPRIEYTDSLGTFTNLFEFDGRMTVRTAGTGTKTFSIATTGELKDRNWLSGGIGYRLEHRYGDREVLTTVHLTYHDARRVVSIVEPIIDRKGMTFERMGPRAVRINAGKRVIEFTLLEGEAELRTGVARERYWAPYPALRAYPIELIVHPAGEEFTREITYRLRIIK